MNSEQFIESLDDQLRAAAHRKFNSPRPSRSWRLLQLTAAAAVTVVAAGLLSVVAGSRDASADVEVIREGNEFIVRLNDLETQPEEIERATLEAGLDVKVLEVPVGPSNVGRFVGATSTAPLEDLHVIDGDRSTGFNGFRIPVDFNGRLELVIGRPAEGGEPWQISSWSTARGEPLACQRVEGRSVGAVLELARSRGLDEISVSVIDDPGGPRAHKSDLSRFASATVFRVMNSSPDELDIEAAWDASMVAEGSTPPVATCSGSEGE